MSAFVQAHKAIQVGFKEHLEVRGGGGEGWSRWGMRWNGGEGEGGGASGREGGGLKPGEVGGGRGGVQQWNVLIIHVVYQVA